MSEEGGLPARKRKGGGQDGKRQRVREPRFFLRSACFQPATMIHKAAAKVRRMAALPGGRLADRDT